MVLIDNCPCSLIDADGRYAKACTGGAVSGVKHLVKMGLLAFEHQEYDQALQVSTMLCMRVIDSGLVSCITLRKILYIRVKDCQLCNFVLILVKLVFYAVVLYAHRMQ